MSLTFIAVGVGIALATWLLYTGHVPVILQIFPYLIATFFIVAGVIGIAGCP